MVSSISHTIYVIITFCKGKNNKTVYFGTESLSSLASKIWELIPDCLKKKIFNGLQANLDYRQICLYMYIFVGH